MKHATHPVEQEEVMAYLDGELRAERAAEIAGHFQECAHCVSLKTDLRGVSQQMLSWQVEPAPSSLGVLASSIEDKSAFPSRTGFLYGVLRETPAWRRWVWGFACSGLIAAGVWGIWAIGVLRGPMQSRAIARDASTMRMDTYRAQKLDPLGPGDNGIAGGGGDFSLRSVAPEAAARQKAESELASNLESNGKPKNDATFGKAQVYAKILAPSAPHPEGPMIARTASLAITVKNFAEARAAVEKIVAQFRGYIGELTTESPKDAAQTLSATLRIPAPQLDAALVQFKALGRVEQESQGGEEVSEQHADLVARLKNARATEQRLLDVLRQRTGKVSEVLEVEEQIANTRGEIERMEAEQKGLEKRVSYGSVQLKLTEEYKAALNLAPPSILASLRNAAADGYKTLVGSLLGLILWLESYAPVLVFWTLILFWPARLLWRRFRSAGQPAQPIVAA